MLARGGARVWYHGLPAPAAEDFDLLLLEWCPYDTIVWDNVYLRQKEGVKVVLDLDDNIHAFPDNPPHIHPEHPAWRPLDRIIREADALFVTGSALAGRYGPYARQTFVLPNSIDFSLRDWTRRPERDPRLAGRTVIGYAGGITHHRDWRALLGTLPAVVSRTPSATVALCTGPTWKENLALPDGQVVSLDPVDFADYPALLSQFDIGLAPLLDTEFTRCKSDLKLIEYGALGIPYVASDVTPYRRLHEETEGQGGYLCRTAEQWTEALTRLLSDEDERETRGAFMREYVLRERSLEKGAALWAAAFRAVRDGTGSWWPPWCPEVLARRSG
jgi:glycosyltransferase involved in cell wall biosynthesis